MATVLMTPTMSERAEYLLGKMREVSGIDPLTNTRRRPFPSCRVMVASVLLEEGWTEHQVGCALNRNHSTINHYRNKMEEMFASPGYEYELLLWNKFKESL